MISERNEIFGARLGVSLNQLFRFPLLCPPGVANVLVSKLRRMSVGFDVVVILRTALDIHAARIPVALLGNALRTPVRPNTELSVPEPIRAPIRFERLPVWTEGSRCRAYGGTYSRSSFLLT